MTTNLITTNQNAKLALAKSKKLIAAASKILKKDFHKNTEINIYEYLKKELLVYEDFLDESDYNIIKNLVESNSTILLQSIEKKELESLIKNFSDWSVSQQEVPVLLGNCILLAFCKYSLYADENDELDLSIRKVSNELKNIIQTINNIFS